MHARNIEFEGKWCPFLRGETLKAPILHEMLRRAKIAILSAPRGGSSVYAASRRPAAMRNEVVCKSLQRRDHYISPRRSPRCPISGLFGIRVPSDHLQEITPRASFTKSEPEPQIILKLGAT